GIPDAHVLVVTGRDDPRTVETERHARDHLRVPADGHDLVAGLDVPELDGAVDAAGEDAAAVGGEGDRPRRPRMSPGDGHLPPGGHTHEAHDISGGRRTPVVHHAPAAGDHELLAD